MQLSRTLGGANNFIHGMEISMNSIILTVDDGTQLVCTNFHQSRKQKLKLYVWLPLEKKWVVTYAKNEYTEKMWAYYRKCEHKNRIRISIIVDGMHGRKIDVALRTPEDDNFIILDSCDDDYYEEENSVINILPLSVFPAFITQFSNLETEAFSEVWNAWKTIAAYS